MYRKKYLGKDKILGRYVDSYLPFYDEYADFNTNAKSYYDYLARYNKILQALTEIVNQLIDRDIDVKDTNTIEFIKNGNWIAENECDTFTDIIELLANVKISKDKSIIKDYLGKNYKLDNSIVELKDGLYSPDYYELLKSVESKIVVLENKLKDLDFTDLINDIENTLNNIQGINLKQLLIGRDYELKFYNGFYSPSSDLVIQAGETSDTIDIHVSSHSTSGKILKNDRDLRETELSLRPDKDIPEKSKVFSIIFKGDYSYLNSKEIYIDNTTPMLWHIEPVNTRASWSAQLTPHNLSGEINYNWRNHSDGYSRQLRNSYDEKLTLAWGSVQSRITFIK